MSVPENTNLREIRSFMRAVREAKNMSRRDLAEALGVHVNSIRNLETPGESWGGDALFSACEYLGIRLNPMLVRQ